MKVGRNDPCPCGSGKKFKQCCDRKQAKRAELRDSMAKGVFWLFGPLAIILIVGISVAALRGRTPTDEVQRIWSAEHQHWHLLAPDGTEVEARPGLVWNEEQGQFVQGDALTGAVRKHVTSDLDRRLSDVEGQIATEEEPGS